MDSNNDDKNLLWELAQTMTSRDSYPAAAALRKLAQAGYANLEEVDAVSDWVLLATPGIGVGRLGVVRRMIRPDWQPASRKTVEAAERFLTAARFALRFWPVEALASIVEGSMPELTTERPLEKRLALDVFCQATSKALSYCPPQELVEMLQQVSNGHHPGYAGQHPELHHSSGAQTEAMPHEQQKGSGPETSGAEPDQDGTAAESDHYAYSPRRRREIVKHYRAAREQRQVANKDTWAQTNYSISGRTLLRYEQEYFETDEDSQP